MASIVGFGAHIFRTSTVFQNREFSANGESSRGRSSRSRRCGVDGFDRPDSWMGDRLDVLVGFSCGLLLRRSWRRIELSGWRNETPSVVAPPPFTVCGLCAYASISFSSFSETLWIWRLAGGGNAGNEFSELERRGAMKMRLLRCTVAAAPPPLPASQKRVDTADGFIWLRRQPFSASAWPLPTAKPFSALLRNARKSAAVLELAALLQQRRCITLRRQPLHRHFDFSLTLPFATAAPRSPNALPRRQYRQLSSLPVLVRTNFSLL